MDTIISGFKHFKAVKRQKHWAVWLRNPELLVANIANITKSGLPSEWCVHFPAINQVFEPEQLLDLAGLCKSITRREATPVKKSTPLDERIELYKYIAANWKLVLNYTGTPSGLKHYEGYKSKGKSLYVSYKKADGAIVSIDFFRKSDYLGALTIKLIRKEMAFIRKLENVQPW